MEAVYECLCYFLMLYLNIRLCDTSAKTVNEQLWSYCSRAQSELTCSRVPTDLPDRIKSVRLINIDGTQYPDRVLHNGTFSSETWRQVEELEISAENSWLSDHETVRKFDSYCFSGLETLETLHINIITSILFTPKTFSGLRKLKLLDVSGCRRLDIGILINALNGPKLVPNLRALNLSHLHSYRGGIKLTDKFFKIISDKHITALDISSIQVLFMNVTSFVKNCGTLEYLNMSRLMLSDYDSDEFNRVCPKLKYIDASYVVLPSNVIPDRGPRRKIVSNLTIPFSLNWISTESFFNVEYIDISGLTSKENVYVLNNVTALVLGANKLSLKTIIMRDYNIERLDLKFIVPNSTLQSVDLSNCKIRYLNPGVFSSFTLLTRIDISNNRLGVMIIEDKVLFGRLFQNLTQLRYINLVGNGLTEIPCDMFKFNSFIEVIDISDNLLSQVSFDIENLRHIRLINLTRNVIKIFDSSSMSNLNHLMFITGKTGNRTVTSSLVLKENPITCSKCDSLSFVTWLTRSKMVIRDYSEMKCVTEHSNEIFIDQIAIDTVKKICNRPKVIIASCSSAAALIIVVTVTVLLIRRHRRQQQQVLEMEDRVALIREGAESHRFVVFLSFSSKDDDFVYNYVVDPLNKHLQTMIGDRRDLVCEGDRNFQLGRPIHDQISELLKKSSVVVVVLTDNYSLSVHCRNEFDQAFMLEKPIVLMVKDEVDTKLMMPLIRDIYEKKTRVLWSRENGQYVLKTSWENVCSSIIELVDNI